MPGLLEVVQEVLASFSKRRMRTEAPISTSASGTPGRREPTSIGMAVRAGLRLADRRAHVRLEARGHRVLQALGLLVHVVPRHPDDVGEVALDEAGGG
jgi:hypothetical protein